MGSKSSSAPAPDPRLTAAQVKSMGIQDTAIQQIMRNTADLAPLQKQQLQFGLDSAKTAYDQSQADRSWMLTRRNALSGIQDTMVQDAEDFNLEERQGRMLDEANADVDSAFSNTRAQGARGLSRMGVTPGSGRALSLSSTMDIEQAKAKASAAAKVRNAARAEGFALTDRANNALAGYPAMSTAATGAGAAYGASGLGLANTGLAGMNSGLTAGSTAAGQLGQNATGMFGAQASYQNGSQSGSNFGDSASGLGSLVGAGLKLWGAFSDRRLKTNITVVGRDKGTSLPIYEFSYKADPARRFRGVMADEAERVMPAAVRYGADGFARVNYRMLGVPFLEVQHG